MKEPAHVAYDAFAGHLNWMSIDGKPLLQWHELHQVEREAWRAAVAAVT